MTHSKWPQKPSSKHATISATRHCTRIKVMNQLVTLAPLASRVACPEWGEKLVVLISFKLDWPHGPIPRNPSQSFRGEVEEGGFREGNSCARSGRISTKSKCNAGKIKSITPLPQDSAGKQKTFRKSSAAAVLCYLLC